MRLYHQLDQDEQEMAIEHCTEMIVGDLMAGQLDIDLQPDDEEVTPELEKRAKTVKTAIERISTLDSNDDKLDYILANKELMAIVNSLSEEMFRTFHYLEWDDRVMWPEDYQHEGFCPHCQAEGEGNGEELEEEPAPKHRGNTKHSVN